MILIWYCFYNLNETAVCALDIFLVVGELWTKNRKGAKKNIQHTQSLVLFSLSMTQFVILTKIDVDRNSGGKGKPQREGCYQLYWRASLLVIQKLWVINSRILQQRDVEKKRVKRRESVQDENSNQVVWHFIHTKPTCSTRILHRLFKSGNSICTISSVFFELPTDVTFLPTEKIVRVSFFPLFFIFWRLVISYEQIWLLDNMKQVSILYRPAVDLFGLELNWWPGLFTICVASS